MRGNNFSSLSASQRWVLAAVGFSSLMVASQNSALNAVLPIVARSFGVDLASVQWVVLAYLITSSGLLLAFGRLGDVIGQRRLFLAGFVVFIAGSVFSAMAANVLWLVAMRIIQAIGGGMITSAGAPLITKTMPGTHRARGLSAQIVMVYFGLAAGPAIGGFLADTAGWRWVFLANVPVGLIAAAITLSTVPRDETIPARQTFDFPGAFTFMTALASLFLLLTAAKGGSWLASEGPLLFAVFMVSAFAFAAIELRRRQPMIDLALFKSRSFSAAITSAMIIYIGFSTFTFLVPFYLVDGMGYDATRAGLVITAMPIVMMLAAPLSGWISDKFGPRLPASFGMALLFGGIFILGRTAAVSAGEIIPGLLLAGLGLGLFSSANNSAIMGSVPMHRQGIASGVVSTARQLGMMLGVAASTTVFRMRYPLYVTLGEANATAAAVQDTFLAVAAVIACGVLTSLVRGAPAEAGPNAAR